MLASSTSTMLNSPNASTNSKKSRKRKRPSVADVQPRAEMQTPLKKKKHAMPISVDVVDVDALPTPSPLSRRHTYLVDAPPLVNRAPATLATSGTNAEPELGTSAACAITILDDSSPGVSDTEHMASARIRRAPTARSATWSAAGSSTIAKPTSDSSAPAVDTGDEMGTALSTSNAATTSISATASTSTAASETHTLTKTQTSNKRQNRASRRPTARSRAWVDLTREDEEGLPPLPALLEPSNSDKRVDESGIEKSELSLVTVPDEVVCNDEQFDLDDNVFPQVSDHLDRIRLFVGEDVEEPSMIDLFEGPEHDPFFSLNEDGLAHLPSFDEFDKIHEIMRQGFAPPPEEPPPDLEIPNDPLFFDNMDVDVDFKHIVPEVDSNLPSAPLPRLSDTRKWEFHAPPRSPTSSKTKGKRKSKRRRISHEDGEEGGMPQAGPSTSAIGNADADTKPHAGSLSAITSATLSSSSSTSTSAQTRPPPRTLLRRHTETMPICELHEAVFVARDLIAWNVRAEPDALAACGVPVALAERALAALSFGRDSKLETSSRATAHTHAHPSPPTPASLALRPQPLSSHEAHNSRSSGSTTLREALPVTNADEKEDGELKEAEDGEKREKRSMLEQSAEELRARIAVLESLKRKRRVPPPVAVGTSPVASTSTVKTQAAVAVPVSASARVEPATASMSTSTITLTATSGTIAQTHAPAAAPDPIDPAPTEDAVSNFLHSVATSLPLAHTSTPTASSSSLAILFPYDAQSTTDESRGTTPFAFARPVAKRYRPHAVDFESARATPVPTVAGRCFAGLDVLALQTCIIEISDSEDDGDVDSDLETQDDRVAVKVQARVQDLPRSTPVPPPPPHAARKSALEVQEAKIALLKAQIAAAELKRQLAKNASSTSNGNVNANIGVKHGFTA